MNESFMKVFALVAESGEYDDYRKWIVAIYDNEADALAHKFYADQEAEKVRTKNDWQVRDSFKNAFDPGFDGRLGTIYSVEEYGVCDTFKKECFPEPTPEPEDVVREFNQSNETPIYPVIRSESPWVSLGSVDIPSGREKRDINRKMVNKALDEEDALRIAMLEGEMELHRDEIDWWAKELDFWRSKYLKEHPELDNWDYVRNARKDEEERGF